jgi:TolB-like protein
MPMGKGLPILATLSLLSSSLMTLQEVHADQLTAPRILVIPFTNSTGEPQYDALRDGMGDLLVAGFSQFEDLVLVDRENLDQVTQELSLSLAGDIGRSQSIIVAMRVGANRLITGGLTLTGDQIAIDAHVFDVATTQLIASHRLSGKVEQSGDLAGGVARKIFASLGLDSRSPRELPLDQQPQVNLHFIRGLGYYYANLYNHAIPEFMKALDLNADFPEARFWTAKSYYAGGALDHARIELHRFKSQFPAHRLSKKVDVLLNSMKRTK